MHKANGPLLGVEKWLPEVNLEGSHHRIFGFGRSGRVRLLVRRGVVGAFCVEVGAEVGASPAVVVHGRTGSSEVK